MSPKPLYAKALLCLLALLFTTLVFSDIVPDFTSRPKVVAFMSINDTIVDQHSYLTFQDQSIGAKSYEWFVNGESLSTEKDFSYQFSKAGTYEVMLKASKRSWKHSTVSTITVTPFEYCASDKLLQEQLQQDPRLEEQLEFYEAKIRQYIDETNAARANQRQGGNCTEQYVLPVVFHVLSQNNDIPVQQIMDQLDRLNTEFGGQNPNTQGVNTCISFCLAQVSPDVSGDWAPYHTGSSEPITPGITRNIGGNNLYNHAINGSGAADILNSIYDFPPEEYLNVWIVDDIVTNVPGGTVLGYAPYPLTNNDLDGVVIRADVIGNDPNNTALRQGFRLGQALVHEVGHYLNLYHVFQNGCDNGGPCDQVGDRVCDTQETNRTHYGPCNLGVLSCGRVAPDYDENFNHMDYSGDDCKHTFTQGQAERMCAVLNVIPRRVQLFSIFNMVNTGVASNTGCLDPNITSEFIADKQQACSDNSSLGQPTQVTFTGAGMYDDWEFKFTGPNNQTFTESLSSTGSGSPSTPMVTTTLPAAGSWTVQLTVTNTTSQPSGSSTTTEKDVVFANDCGPVDHVNANWYFGNYVGLDFTSGAPVQTTPALLKSDEVAASVSDAQGNLLFYTEGKTVWDANHNVMATGLYGSPNGPEIGSSQGALIVPDPGNSDRYYIFTTSDLDYNNAAPNKYGLTGTLIDMTLNNGLGGVSGAVNGIAPSQNYATTEHLMAVPHANGTDYWIVVHGNGNNVTSGSVGPALSYNGSPIGSERTLLAYLLTASGLSDVPVVSDAHPFTVLVNPGPANQYWDWRGSMDFSKDGTRMAAQYINGGFLFDFNRGTGRFHYVTNFTNGWFDQEFSPSGEFLYVTKFSRVYQFDLRNVSPFNTVLPVKECGIQSNTFGYDDIQMGPDGKMYGVVKARKNLYVFNYPDEPVTDNDPNSVGYVEFALTLTGTATNRQGLPNIIDAATDPPPYDFSYFTQNCGEVWFRNSSAGDTVTWDFGDGTTPITGAADDMIPNGTHGGNTSGLYFYPYHQYTAGGTYTVTMSIDGQPAMTKTVVIQVPAAIVSPGGDACLGDEIFYSTNLSNNTNYSFDWTVTGPGAINFGANTSNPSVSWTGLGAGTVSVTITDLTTGCTQAGGLNIQVHDYPTVDAGPDIDTASCGGFTIQLNGISNASCQWVPGVGLDDPTSCNPQVVSLVDTMYTLFVTDSNGCAGYDSIHVKVTTAQLMLTFSTVDATNDTSSDGAVKIVPTGGTEPYQYSIGDTFQGNSSFPGLPAGTYVATVSDSNGCMAMDTFVINNLDTVSTGVPPSAMQAGIEVYPNPNNDRIYIKTTNEITSLRLYEATGKLVRQATVAGAQTYTIHHGLPSGVYFLQATVNDTVYTTKVVVR